MKNGNDFAFGEYSVVRSKRRSISVEVNAEGRIIVRCPYRATELAVSKFLKEKSAWIIKKSEERRYAADELSEMRAYKKVLVGGKAVPLELGKRNGVSDGCVCASDVKRLEAVYIKEYGGEFLKMFYEISEKYGFKPLGVAFRNYKSRWGCCDVKGKITFNYKLLMLPYNLRFYVAAHELCHLLVFDHSSAFKRELAKIDSDWKEHKELLNKYSCVIRLY